MDLRIGPGGTPWFFAFTVVAGILVGAALISQSLLTAP